MTTELDIEPCLKNLEIPQKPYSNGLFGEIAPAQSIPYGPTGFTVATVLSGTLMQVPDADDTLPTDEGRSWPVKTAFHFEFVDPAYDTPVHTKQFRVPKTKGAFAILAAKEIQNMLAKLPRFPFLLDQLRVVSIDICSRGTVQPRIFVDGFMMKPEELNNLAERLRG